MRLPCVRGLRFKVCFEFLIRCPCTVHTNTTCSRTRSLTPNLGLVVGIRGKHLDSQYTILFGAHLWHFSPRSCLVSRRPLARRRRVCCALCDGSDAPLHVLSVELELCFGDVVVEFLDGLGIVCALLVGDVLAGEVRGRCVLPDASRCPQMKSV